MSKYSSEILNSIKAYTPGEQPRDKKYIKLNTNESPYPPSKGVIEAINKSEIEDLRLYCDPECKRLKELLSDAYNVRPQNIFVSNGSDDILNFAFMAYGKDGAVFPDITYGFYSVFAELHNIKYETVPLTDDFKIDTGMYLNRNKLIVIANPNAPTGIDIPLEEIEKIIKSNPQSVVLIDEAYVDFGGESCAELTEKYDNLLCVHTYSKSRSMAGARLGFAIANEEIIKDLEKIKYSTNPYNINRLTQIAGAVAITEDDYYKENCKKIIQTREYTANALKELNFTVLPSKTNFLFAKSDIISGEDFYLKLKDRGVLVRHFGSERIKDFNRITIGSYDEMVKFIEITKQILDEQRKA